MQDIADLCTVKCRRYFNLIALRHSKTHCKVWSFLHLVKRNYHFQSHIDYHYALKRTIKPSTRNYCHFYSPIKNYHSCMFIYKLMLVLTIAQVYTNLKFSCII